MTEKKKRAPLWRTLYDDSSILLVRAVEPRRFHFIEATDMDDACGSDNADSPRYVVELNEVDLDAITEKTIASAQESCGWERSDGEAHDDTAIAEMCHSYGARAPLGSWAGGAHWHDDCPRELIRTAKRESRLLDDPSERMERLSRPVNKIGSTALEYMQGDLFSAMQRGVEKGDALAKIMAKMHGVPDDKIAAVEAQGPRGVVMAQITLQKVPSDDPLAYSVGFISGLAGNVLESERSDLADAYIEGYRLGVAVRLGDEPRPDWAK